VLGGIPATLGGGGLEVQRDATLDALRARGHDAFLAESAPATRSFDLLHIFGSEADVWHVLQHWRRNPAPLVVSPVVVVAEGAEHRLVLTSKMRRPLTVSRMRSEVLRRADLLVALTRHEQQLLRRVSPGTSTVVIGNGVNPLAPDTGRVGVAPGIDGAFVLMAGTVSRRKRQTETVRAIAESGLVPVVAGGFQGSDAERRRFEDTLEKAGGTWVGEQSQSVVRALMREATALVHLSGAEGQSLAILESLAEGTPVLCSNLPSNRELAVDYPGWVRINLDLSRLPADVRDLVKSSGGTPPAIPTWHDVGRQLEAEYERLLSSAS
jgi:glycosyltransferase involved in cell wall biosynthesis